MPQQVQSIILLAPGDADFEPRGERQLPEADLLRDTSNHCESVPVAVVLSVSRTPLNGEWAREPDDLRCSDSWAQIRKMIQYTKHTVYCVLKVN